MKPKHIVAQAILDEAGFNFDTEGNVVNFTEGYMVGGFHKCLKISRNYVKVEEVIDAVEEMLTLLESFRKHSSFPKNFVLGAWVKDGFIYLDISKNIRDKMTALHTGTRQSQKAIYDIKNNVDIEL
jgi:hypothetical protein